MRHIQTAAAAWQIDDDPIPLVATAVHDGHELRDEVAALIAIDEITRLREEDAYSRLFTRVAPVRVIGLRSRFEIDLNRPRREAICVVPEDCWDLDVWQGAPPEEVVARSLHLYDDFYERLHALLEDVQRRCGGFVVLDLHSYNYRRAAANDPGDPQADPDVNVGTGSLDRDRWGSLVERFIDDLSLGGLDVRENVKFKGRQLARFVHENFPLDGCCLAVEIKKTYVDEWTGELDEGRAEALVEALVVTVPGLMAELDAVITPTHERSVGSP